jgi:hypothetical protein
MTIKPLCGFCGYTLEKCQCKNEREKMNTTEKALSAEKREILTALLNAIWKLGDRDEMSIKHIGHGLAALTTWGDWERAIDYNRPHYKMTKAKEEILAGLWADVKALLEGLTRAQCIAVFESLEIAWYGYAYLEWPQYAETESAGK